jgi:hypothetical protein
MRREGGEKPEGLHGREFLFEPLMTVYPSGGSRQTFEDPVQKVNGRELLNNLVVTPRRLLLLFRRTKMQLAIAVPVPPASSINAQASTIKLAESRTWSSGLCVRPCWMNNPPDVGRHQATQ